MTVIPIKNIDAINFICFVPILFLPPRRLTLEEPKHFGQRFRAHMLFVKRLRNKWHIARVVCLF